VPHGAVINLKACHPTIALENRSIWSETQDEPDRVGVVGWSKVWFGRGA
jgi:hypothetical protein